MKLPSSVSPAWPGSRGTLEIFVSLALRNAAAFSFGITMCVNIREGSGISAITCRRTRGEDGMVRTVGSSYVVVNLFIYLEHDLTMVHVYETHPYVSEPAREC